MNDTIVAGGATFITFLTVLSISGSRAEAQTAPAGYRGAAGTNLHFYRDWSSESWALVDVFKSSRPWVTQCNFPQDAGCTAANLFDTGEAALLDLDEHGWVRSLPLASDAPIYTSVATVLFTDIGAHYPGGQYVVYYEGEGTIEYAGAATKNLANSVPGRDVVDVNPTLGQVHLRITATDPNHTGNYIRNIRMITPGYDGSSEMFNATFLSLIERYQTIRSIHWSSIIASDLIHWTERPVLGDARWSIRNKGMPIEVTVALINRLRTTGWFNVPAKADDDYIARYAALVRDTLDPSLRVYVEYSDEIWNDAPGFTDGRWVEGQALARWPDGQQDAFQKRINWNGMRTAQMCDIWKSVWGAQAGRVSCVMSAQAANPWTSSTALDCPLWTEGAPCSAHGIDAITIAPYFTIHVANPATHDEVLGWTLEPDGGLNKVFQELNTGGAVSPGNGYPGGALKEVFDWIDAAYAIAQPRGLQLVAYEAGQDLVDPAGDPALTTLFINANRDPRMGDAYDRYLAGWRDHGGSLLVHFTNVAKFQSNGLCGSLEYMDQTHSPKRDALMRFLDGNVCWWACTCGNGVLDPWETCDDGNQKNGDCCSSSCTLDPATTICRASTGTCDPAEYCTGTSAGCPTDAKRTDMCRPVANACDTAAEYCNGISGSCPADGPARDCSGLSTDCAAGSCDLALGCVANPIRENLGCDDHNPATANDVCYRGACVAGNPVPSISQLLPNLGPLGASGGNIVVTGSNFVPASQVTWAGANMTTTYVSATQLQARLTATLTALNGNYDVRVVNPIPGGGTSAARTFTVNNPVPVLQSISPTSITGEPTTSLAVTINGYNFAPNATVSAGGASSVQLTSVSASRLTVSIPATSLSAGTYNISVTNPGPGGGTSASSPLVVNSPLPVLASISPATAASGASASLILNGSGFVRAAQARVNGTATITSWISATQLRVTIPSALLPVPGTYTITVFNPAPAGGTSAGVALAVTDPPPVLSSIAPASATAGAAAVVLTLTGSSFNTSSAVSFGGTPLVTTFLTMTQLTAIVPIASLAAAGTFSVLVTTTGGTSGAQTFTVNNPLPVLLAMVPNSATAGDAGATLSLTGSSFAPGAQAVWDGANIPTTYSSPVLLTATLSAAQLAAAGYHTVAVNNPVPGGGSSATQTFTVNNPLPVLSASAPDSVILGAAATTLSLSGASFAPGAAASLNGVALATTYVSASQLTAVVPAELLTAAGTYPLTVTNAAPGGGTSAAAVNFTVNNPAPVLSTVAPASATVGAAALTVTITGSSFIGGSQATLNGAVLATTYVSASQLTATIPASLMTAAGIYPVAVVNGAPGGGTSTAAVNFTVNNPLPVLTALTPAVGLTGAAGGVITASGSAFVRGSAVVFNGVTLATTYVSATQLTATLGAAQLATAGTYPVTVVTPGPGGGTSATRWFIVGNNPVPILTSISPSTAVAGSGSFTLTLNGLSFFTGSGVRFNGNSLATTVVSATRLTAVVPASAITAAGTYSVNVINPAPGGGTSLSQTFTVTSR